MGVASAPALSFGTRFARELPELAVPWQADEAPDPRLLVLNDRSRRSGGWTRAGCAPRTGCGC